MKSLRLNNIQLCGILFIILLSLRILYTQSLTYTFLIWNVFLAFVPYLLGRLYIITKVKDGIILKTTIGVLWLLFLPNAPYIITDIFHLTNVDSAPLWFDTIFLMTSAILGLLIFYQCIKDFEQYITTNRSFVRRQLILFTIMILCGFGIYLGRFLRLNSWEVFTNPANIFTIIFDTLLHPLEHTKCWGVTLIYGFSLYIGHLIYNNSFRTLQEYTDTKSKIIRNIT